MSTPGAGGLAADGTTRPTGEPRLSPARRDPCAPADRTPVETDGLKPRPAPSLKRASAEGEPNPSAAR